MNRLELLREENLSLKKELQLIQIKYQELLTSHDQLLLAFKQLQRRQFGSSSERYVDQHPAQADLFSTVEAILQDESDDDPELNKPKKPRRKRKKTADFAKNLPRREVIIPVEDKGANDRVIRYEVTELFHYVPPVYEIIVQKREVVVRSTDIESMSHLIVAPNPPRLLPKAGVTNDFLAHVIVGKFYDRQPLYHLSKKFKQRFDFTCSRGKLARWVIDSAHCLQPLTNLMQDIILEYDIAGCDPTHLQVLDEPGRAATQKSYLYSIRGGPPNQTVIRYVYNATDHKSFLRDWFEGYQGYLLVDGQNIFEVLDQSSGIQLQLCNSHARRKFEPIAKATNRIGLAHQAMRFYRALYKLERQAKKEQMTAEQRYQWRLTHSQPLIDQFECWLEEHMPLTLPKSPLGKAMAYVAKRTTGLRCFLADGRLEIDTNELEQKNKDVALARNNFLFCYSVEGAEALSTHLSLIVTAVEHGLDPYRYYVQVMNQIPHCQTVEDYEWLLPWQVKQCQWRAAAA